LPHKPQYSGGADLVETAMGLLSFDRRISEWVPPGFAYSQTGLIGENQPSIEALRGDYRVNRGS